MTRYWLHISFVGLAAGLCSALMFASLVSGSALSLLLCYLAPLPILIAGLGGSHWAGLVATVAAAITLGLAIDASLVIVFPIGLGLPAWWLGYLTLLARPAGPNG